MLRLPPGLGTLSIYFHVEGGPARGSRLPLARRPIRTLGLGMLSEALRGRTLLYRPNLLLTKPLLSDYAPNETARDALLQPRVWARAGDVRASPDDPTTIQLIIDTFMPEGQTIKIDGRLYTITEVRAPIRADGETTSIVPEKLPQGGRTARRKRHPHYSTLVTLVVVPGKVTPQFLSFTPAACSQRKRDIARDYDIVFVEPGRQRRAQERAKAAEKRRELTAARVRALRPPASPGPESSATDLPAGETQSSLARKKARKRQVAMAAAAAARRKTGGRRRARRRSRPATRRRRRRQSRTRRRVRRKPRARGSGMHRKSMRRRFRA